MHARTTAFARLLSDSVVRRRCLTATALIVFFALCAASPLRGAGNPTFNTPVNVSNDGSGNFPQIIVDSSGNIDIAYADANPTGNCKPATPTLCQWTGALKFVRSTDGGKTFSAPVTLASTGAGPFRMALETDCTIDLVYFANGDVFFAQSTDCGKSFAPVNITNTGNMSPGVAMQMVVNQGVASIGWQVAIQAPPTPTIYYAQGNAKSGFGAPSVLATQPEGVMELFGMAPVNGTTDILWWAGEFNFSIFLSLNGGAPTALAAGSIGAGPFFSIDPSGNVGLVWGQLDVNGNNVIQFVRAGGQTGTFGSVQTVAVGFGPGIATDAQGNIGVAWSGVLFGRSTDGGTTFSMPTTVNSGVSGTVDPSPQVVLPDSSFAGVAWGQGSDLWFNSSSDSGATFSSAVNVTNNKSSPSALQMITDSAGDVLMVWSGNDAQGHDVFFSRGSVTQSSSGGISGTVSPTSATIAVGSSATFAVSLMSGAFAGPVDLACSGLASGLNCSFSPGHVTLAAGGSGSSTLTVSVASKPSISWSAPPAANPQVPRSRNLPLLPPLLTIVLALAAELLIVILSGCGICLPKNLSPRLDPRKICSPAFAGLGKGWGCSSLRHDAIRENPHPFRLPLESARSHWGRKGWATNFVRLGGTTRPWASPARLAAVAFALVLVLAVGLISCGGTTSKSTSTSGGGTTGTTGSTGGTGGTGGSSVTTQFTVQAKSGGATIDLGTLSITVP